jgi:plastocyanin
MPVRRRASRSLLPAFITALAAAVLVAVAGAALVVTAPVARAQQGGDVVEGTAALKWEPAELRVNPGDSVTFRVTGGPPHPVAPKDGPPTGSPDFDTSGCQLAQMSAVGDECTVELPSEGTFDYICSIHQAVGMVGRIVVGEGGSSGTGGGTRPTPSPSPSATPDTPTAATVAPGRPGIYYAGWGLLAIGGVLALAAIAGYLRFAPDFSRERK